MFPKNNWNNKTQIKMTSKQAKQIQYRRNLVMTMGPSILYYKSVQIKTKQKEI